VIQKYLFTILLTLTIGLSLFANPKTRLKEFQIERKAPIQLKKTANGSWFADFGKDAFGTLELKYKSLRSDTLIICLGEKLLDGKIDHNPGGSIRFTEVRLPVFPNQYDYTLTLKADKRNTSGDAVLLPDSFSVITPFRYAEISHASQPVSKGDIRQMAYFHTFDESQSYFTSSDTVLNRVWELCKYSIKATSYAGLYIDGDRERIPYAADAYINQLGHYCTDRDYSMAQKTIEHFMTHPTWPTEWLLHTALMMYQDYYYTGDKSLLIKYYDQLKAKTLTALMREDGLISTETGLVTGELMQQLGFQDTTKRLKDIVDWPPSQKDTGWKLFNPAGERDGHEMVAINTVVNCFFYENLKIMAEISKVLIRSSDNEFYELMAGRVRSSINRKLFNAGKGIYLDGEGSTHSSLHSNMMALAFGIVPADRVKSVTDFVKSRGMACSVYGAQYLLEGLYNYGESQYALDLLRATGDRSWWNMIRVGSTLTMEAWDMKYKPNSDWNHAWGAAPANIIPRQLWGIKPKSPGFDKVSIHPRMGDILFSTIKTPTIHGSVKGDYRLINSTLMKYTLVLPAKISGELLLGESSGEIVKLDGKIIQPMFRTIPLHPGTNHIEIKLLTH